MRTPTKIKELVLKILTEQEQKELEKPEKENMKTIEEVHKAFNPLHQPFTKDHHITLQSIKTPFFTTAT